MLVIPAIDIMEGQAVRLTGGDYGRVTRYAVDPLKLLEEWAGLGIKRVHLVFLGAAREGKLGREEARFLETFIRAKARLGLELQVGGGIRTPARAKELLEEGVDYVIIGTAAVLELVRGCGDVAGAPEGGEPGILEQLKREKLSRRVLVALDTRNGEVAVQGWRRTVSCAPESLVGGLEKRGYRQVLYTCAERDGTLEGPDAVAVKRLAERAPGLSVIVAGGIGKEADLLNLVALNLPNLFGVVVGKALYEGKVNLAEVVKKIPQ